jgi:dienelactone hydrolase
MSKRNPNADHGFARKDGPAFDSAAAALAEERSFALLDKILLD